MLANPKGRRLLSRPKVNLLEVLRDSSRFDVTDERDRLYGVIGMRIGQIMQTPANLFRLEFNKRLVELVDESTSKSISIKEKYLTSEKTWCNALQTVPNLQENDVCVHLAGSYCQHILRPLLAPAPEGKFMLPSTIEILHSTTQNLDLIVSEEKGPLEEFILV